MQYKRAKNIIMQNHIAIVISWGGMTASYQAGCVYALATHLGCTDVDIVIAGSWWCGTMSYYVAQQYEQIKHIRCDLLSTSKFIHKRRMSKVIDIDYLIDTVFKQQASLDISQIKSSSTKYYITATNQASGQVEFLNTKNHDVYELMRASKAMPIVYNKSITINNKSYGDSPNSSAIEPKISQSIKMWVTHIIIIDGQQKTPRWIIQLFLLGRGKTYKQWFWKEYNVRKNYVILKGIKSIRLIPQKPIKTWILNNNKNVLQWLFDQGVTETINNIHLKKFLALI